MTAETYKRPRQGGARTGTERPPPLQEVHSGIARNLSEKLPRTDEPRSDQILDRITSEAVSGVAGAEYAGLSTHGSDGISCLAASDPIARDAVRLQAELVEGPCIDVPGSGLDAVVGVDDVTTDWRWPRFGPAVAGVGIRSILFLPLSAGSTGRVALALYSSRPHAFDDTDRLVGTALAQHAAVAVHGAELIAGLENALETRDDIGQAKGILVERLRLTGQQAFELLVESSQHTNIRLVEVARWLVSDSIARRPVRADPADPAADPFPRRPRWSHRPR